MANLLPLTDSTARPVNIIVHILVPEVDSYLGFTCEAV